MLMNSENHTCNPRNNMPGTIYFSSYIATEDYSIDCSKVHLDYKDSDVSTYSILDVLRQRSSNILSGLRKLNFNKDSRIFIYVTTHGGDHFIKIRDRMVLLSDELNRTLLEMHLKQKYKEIVFFLDTCEAFTLFDSVTAPNIYFFGTALLDEKAKSHHFSDFLHTSTSDRGSFMLKQKIEEYYKLPNTESITVDKILRELETKKDFLDSTPRIKTNIKREMKYSEFFGMKNAGVSFIRHSVSLKEKAKGNIYLFNLYIK